MGLNNAYLYVPSFPAESLMSLFLVVAANEYALIGETVFLILVAGTNSWTWNACRCFSIGTNRPVLPSSLSVSLGGVLWGRSPVWWWPWSWWSGSALCVTSSPSCSWWWWVCGIAMWSIIIKMITKETRICICLFVNMEGKGNNFGKWRTQGKKIYLWDKTFQLLPPAIPAQKAGGSNATTCQLLEMALRVDWCGRFWMMLFDYSPDCLRIISNNRVSNLKFVFFIYFRCNINFIR